MSTIKFIPFRAIQVSISLSWVIGCNMALGQCCASPAFLTGSKTFKHLFILLRRITLSIGFLCLFCMATRGWPGRSSAQRDNKEAKKL
ncbi:hypothetical protein BDW72DRAFT_176027 [Aspergillus terricola var. indicus]